MSDYQNIINELAEKKHIETDEVSALQKMDFSIHEKLPIMNEILIGFGAFLSTLFFCGFVAAISFIGSTQQYIFAFWSLIFILLAFGCNTLSVKAEGNSGMAFWRDTSVCFMLAGKALFLGASYQFFHSGIHSDITIFLLSSIFITAIIYPFYENPIDRFISVFFISMLTWFKIFHINGTYYSNQGNFEAYRIKTSLMVNAYLFCHFVALTYLLYKPKIYAIYDPIKYALIFSILFYFLFSRFDLFFLFRPVELFHYFLCTLMATGACAIIMELNGMKKTCLSQPLLFVLLLVLFLGLILSPEIMFALILILYGYGHRENKILTLGLVFLPWFLFNYYYYMPVSLLHKSIYLMIAGGVLVLLALYYQYEIKKDMQDVKK